MAPSCKLPTDGLPLYGKNVLVRKEMVVAAAASAYSANGFADVPGFKSACFLACAISC